MENLFNIKKNYYSKSEIVFICLAALLMLNIMLILYFGVFEATFSKFHIFYVLIPSLLFNMFIIYNLKSDSHLIILSSPIPTLVVNKNHIVTHFNKAFEDLTGTLAKDIIGKKNVYLAYKDSDSPTLAMRIIDGSTREEIEKEFSDMNTKYINDGYEGEFYSERIGKNGKWIQFRVAPIKNKKSRIIGSIVTMIDITQKKESEKEIIESKDLYYKLINLVPNSFVIHTQNKILFSNIKGSKLFGFKDPQELLEHKLKEFFPNEDYKKIKIYINKLIKEKGSTSLFKRKILNNNGQIINVKAQSSFFKYNGIDALITTIDDVSDQLQIKQELNLQKEYFNNLFEGSPLPIVMFDKHGFVININNSFKNLFQYSKSEILKQKLCNLIIPKHLGELHCKTCNSVKNGEIVYSETQSKCKDNSIIDVSVVWYPVVINHKHIATYGIYRNITEQIQTQKELIKSEEKYRQLIESLPLGILVHNGGNIIFANSTSEKILGITKSGELLGTSIINIIHPEYKEYISNRIQKLSNGEHLNMTDATLTKFDGTPINVEINSILLENIDEPVILSALIDISEKKKAEELQKKFDNEKTKLEFFANLSHELRTPLNVIFSTTQLLTLYLNNKLINDSDNRIAKRVYSLKQNSFRLLRLVNNLIDVTRIDSGFYYLEIQNHDIVKHVEEILLSVTDYIQSSGIQFEFSTKIKKKIIAFDPSIIERIILNIISNAIKFTPSGGNIKIVIYEKKSNILISIKDSGIGIKKENIETVFERFVQVNKSLTRPHEGSGIGLYLVKSLIEMHGGNIYVESVYGKGSNFTIELPTKTIDIEENNNIKTSSTIDSKDSINNINIEFSDIYKKNQI